MKFRKVLNAIGLIGCIVMMTALGCSFSDGVDEVGTTLQDADDHSDETIPATAASIGKATGIPYAGEALGFLTSLLIGVVTGRKKKEAEKVAEEMAKAIEKSDDKKNIAAEVERKVGLLGLAKLALSIVSKATK